MRRFAQEPVNTGKPFPVFENLIKAIRKESASLFADTQRAYDSVLGNKEALEKTEKGKAALNNAKKLFLLVKDFRNYMKMAVQITKNLPVVIPWWLGREEEEGVYESEYAREVGVVGTAEDQKRAFLMWIGTQRKPTQEDLWFPPKEDEDRAEKIRRTYQYLVRAFMDRKGILKTPIRESEARQRAKNLLRELGYGEEVIVFAIRNLTIRTAQSIAEEWNSINDRMKEIYKKYFPTLRKAYEDLTRAWEPKKFGKNLKMLNNFVLGFGRTGVGLLETGDVFQKGVETLVRNLVVDEKRMSSEDRAVLEEVRETNEQGKRDIQQNQTEQTGIESIDQALHEIKEEVEKWQQGPESVRELARTVAPAVDLEYNEEKVDKLIESLRPEEEAEDEIKGVEDQKVQLRNSLIPVIQDARGISEAIETNREPDKGLMKQLEKDIDEAVGDFRELSTKVKALDEIKKPEEVPEKVTPDDLSQIETLRNELNKTLETVLKVNPERVKDVEKLKTRMEQIEQTLKEKREVASVRGLSKSAQNPVVEEVQELINKAKEMAKEEGVVPEEVEEPLEELDTKLDSMLTEIGEDFKKTTNDQIGAVSRILEGLRRQNIEFDEDRVIPHIEEAANRFRGLYFEGVDEVLKEVADDDERGRKFFQGDRVVQQEVMDQMIERVANSWEEVGNTLTEGIVKGLGIAASLDIRRLSVAQEAAEIAEKGTELETTKEQIRGFVNEYLNRDHMVKILKDVFQKTIDKNRQEIKGLVEKQKGETTTSVLINLFKRRLIAVEN